MIWAFEVDSASCRFSRRFYRLALEKGLLLRPIGNTVYFMPPYTVTDEEISFLAAKTLEILEQV